MRLADLEPRWGADAEGRHGTHLVFLCPTCRETSLGGRIAVPLNPPLDGGNVAHPVFWGRSGETFETLSLTPSIDFKHIRDDGSPCRWHGFVTNGEVTTC